MQAAFISIWNGRGTYRRDPGATVRSWILRCVRNRSLDALRNDAVHRRGLRDAPCDFEQQPRPDAEPGVAEQVERRGQSRALADALTKLPPAQAEVVGLAFFGGLTHVEISECLGMPIGTIKGRARLGLQKLQRDRKLAEAVGDRPEHPAGADRR